KSADEAFKFWGHDEALRRMVLEIRKLRPDVIITNHSVTTNDHGHHQATARLELEAFDAAADPKRFPEQLSNGVTVWQVQRLFVRARGNATQNPDRQGGGEVITIDPNERDQIRNTVFAEEALRALQKHATQGPWPKTFAYRLTREAKGAEAVPKDSHNFVDGLRLPDDIARQLQQLNMDPRSLISSLDRPDRVLDNLLKASKAELFDERKADDADSDRFLLMTLRLDAALAQASGISLTVRPRSSVLVPNTNSTFVITVSNKGPRTAEISGATFDPQNFHIDAGNVKTPSRLAPKATINIPVERKTPADSKINVPLSAHLYDPDPFGEPILAFVRIDIGDAFFGLISMTHIDVAPPVEIAEVAPFPLIVTRANMATTPALNGDDQALRARRIWLNVKVVNHQTSAFKGTLSAASMLADNRSDSDSVELAANQAKTLRLTISSVGNSLTVSLGNGKVFAPTKNIPVSYTDAHVAPNLRVGYIRGFDYSLPNALNALGVESNELTVDTIASMNRSRN
ncbi:MAG: hypothetical protein DMF70_15075, partial [Acidobacteria bacterium]